MPDVAILIPGYYRAGPPVHAVATTTLVRGPGWTWVVDPGSAPAEALIAALAQHGLTPDDVDTLFLTHAHMDHIRHAGLFTKARVLDAWGWWEGDVWREFDEVLPEGLERLATPGHSADLFTLLVATPAGRVAICGDVFYSAAGDNRADLAAADPFAEDLVTLADSRRRVLAAADFVVPGHGVMFPTR